MLFDNNFDTIVELFDFLHFGILQSASTVHTEKIVWFIDIQQPLQGSSVFAKATNIILIFGANRLLSINEYLIRAKWKKMARKPTFV